MRALARQVVAVGHEVLWQQLRVVVDDQLRELHHASFTQRHGPHRVELPEAAGNARVMVCTLQLTCRLTVCRVRAALTLPGRGHLAAPEDASPRA